jgi:hypothetical protein
VKPPSGLTLLQGMLLLGPGRMRRVEKYGRAAGGGGGDGVPGLAVPAGIGEWHSDYVVVVLLWVPTVCFFPTVCFCCWGLAGCGGWRSMDALPAVLTLQACLLLLA